MTTFKTYRNGPTEMEKRIKAATRHFYQVYQALPAAIVVHRSELVAARVAVEWLALRVPVESVGGCLVPEIWLEIAEEGSQC